MKIRKMLLSFLFIILLVIPIGFSAWIFSNLDINIGAQNVPKEPVAYIQRGVNRVNYVSLERALGDAIYGDKIYIIPNKGKSKCYLNTDASVRKGVTLILPYDNNQNYSRYDVKDGHALFQENVYMQTEMLLNEGVTLTNYGSIIVGGVMSGGSGGHYNNGQNCSDYGQITLCKNSQIINKIESSMTLFGIVREKDAGEIPTTQILNESGSLFKAPFVVTEHRGGTIYTAMYNSMKRGTAKASPFNRWFFANALTNVRFNPGSKFIAHADLFAQKQHNHADINILGQDKSYLINTQSDTVVDCYTTVKKFPWNTSFEFVNNITIHGSFNMNNMSMTIQGMTINTKSVLFPISYHQNIKLKKSLFGVESHVMFDQNIKLLPGANFVIENGVSCNIDKMAVYEAFEDVGLGSFAYPKRDQVESATLIIKGTLSCNTFGGFAQTLNDGALFVINANSTITTYEVKSAPGTVAAILGGQADFNSFNWSASGYIANELEMQQLQVKTPYEGVTNKWTISTRARAYNLTFNANDPAPDDSFNAYLWTENEVQKTITFYTFETSPFTIYNAGVSPASCEHYTMIEWVDSENHSLTNNGLTVTPSNLDGQINNYELKASWKPTNYQIRYNLTFEDDYNFSDKTNYFMSSKTFNIIDNNLIELDTFIPQGKEYALYSWYRYGFNGFLSEQVSSLNLVDEFNNNHTVLDLYGAVFKQSSRTTITFNKNNNDYPGEIPYPNVEAPLNQPIPEFFLTSNCAAMEGFNVLSDKPIYFAYYESNGVEHKEGDLIKGPTVLNGSWKNKWKFTFKLTAAHDLDEDSSLNIKFNQEELNLVRAKLSISNPKEVIYYIMPVEHGIDFTITTSGSLTNFFGKYIHGSLFGSYVNEDGTSETNINLGTTKVGQGVNATIRTYGDMAIHFSCG